LVLNLEYTPPDAPLMAQVLREAPQLRHLTFCVMGRADALRVLSEEFTSEPTFAELVHPKLRHFTVTTVFRQEGALPGVSGLRLRERLFPRLRRLTVDDEEYPV
jgi:hypothetical protein